MSYLNRFLIEEEAQLECHGIFEENKASISSDFHLRRIMKRFPYKQPDRIVLHIFEAADFQHKGRVLTVRTAYKLHPNVKLMITRLGSERIERIQQNEYKKFIREGSG